MVFMYSFQKLWSKTFTRDDIWWGKLNLKNLKKEIQIIWSRDRTRPPLFENWNRRFPPLAKQVAPLSLYQNIVPTKCLRISSRNGSKHYNWQVQYGVHWLVPVLLKLTLSTGERRLLTWPHSDCFYMKSISGHFLDLLKENALITFWWEFWLKEYLEKTGRDWSRDANINNF